MAVVNLYAVCCKDSQGNLRLTKFKANYLVFASEEKALEAIRMLNSIVSDKLDHSIKVFRE